MVRTQLLLTFFLVAVAGCDTTDTPTTLPDRGIVNLHPDSPVIEGFYQMTENWSVTLPSSYNRRIEDESMVIWRPGFTIWTQIYGNDDGRSNDEVVAQLQAESSPDAFDSLTETDNNVLRFSYRLNESGDDDRVAAFYCFSVSESGYVMMAIYFDDAGGIDDALNIWRSVRQT